MHYITNLQKSLFQHISISATTGPVRQWYSFSNAQVDEFRPTNEKLDLRMDEVSEIWINRIGKAGISLRSSGDLGLNPSNRAKEHNYHLRVSSYFKIFLTAIADEQTTTITGHTILLLPSPFTLA